MLKTSENLRRYFADEDYAHTVEQFLSGQHFVSNEDLPGLPRLARRSALASLVPLELFEVLAIVFDGTFAEAIRVHNTTFPGRTLKFLDPLIAEGDEIGYHAPTENSVWNETRAIEGIVINGHQGNSWSRARIGVHVLPEGLLVLSTATKDNNQQPIPLEIPGWEDFPERQIISVPHLNLAHGNEFDIEPLRKAAADAVEVISERLTWRLHAHETNAQTGLTV